MTYASKTLEQQQNFRTLLNGMVEMYGDKRFDDHFNMGSYQVDNHKLSNRITKHGCSTSACLLGHGPIFGIGVNHDDFAKKGWVWYSFEFFGLTKFSMGWDFLFAMGWTGDIQEAIARLRMYIDGFDPKNDRWDFINRYTA